MDLAILAAVAGPRGPKAVAAGEAWVPAGSAAADLAAVEAGGAAADFAVAAEVFGASTRRKYQGEGKQYQVLEDWLCPTEFRIANLESLASG